MPTATINGKTVVVPKGHEVVEVNGEKKIVPAAEAKKLLKALKEAAKASSAASGGAEPSSASSAPLAKKPGQSEISFLHETASAAVEAASKEADYTEVFAIRALNWDEEEEARLGKKALDFAGATSRKDCPLFRGFIGEKEMAFEVHPALLKHTATMKKLFSGEANVIVHRLDEGFVSRMKRVHVCSAESTKAGGAKGEGVLREVQEHIIRHVIVALLE